MSTDTRITGPIDIKTDSAERVAYDLMNKIAQFETVKDDAKNREYWLKLYAQCYWATRGKSATDATNRG